MRKEKNKNEDKKQRTPKLKMKMIKEREWWRIKERWRLKNKGWREDGAKRSQKKKNERNGVGDGGW